MRFECDECHEKQLECRCKRVHRLIEYARAKNNNIYSALQEMFKSSHQSEPLGLESASEECVAVGKEQGMEK